MPPRSILWVLVLVSVGFLQVIRAEGTGQRTLHRLVGGHLNIHPELDDAELIITSSAGGGREGKQKVNDDGEDKKTLSQQVADGKYGLIQKELFNKPSKRPGIISYESNPEVPSDNIDNLGGLNKNDIWLAENHLLVIKGGAFPAHDASSDINQPAWDPIDDYKAPGRQVKIPAHPKVPPPFPVQLLENGPLQILGTNSTTTLNGTFAAAPYPLPPPEGGFYPAYPPGDPYPPNITTGETPFPIPPFPPQGDYGPPFPPFPINGSLPPYFASLPPGAAILPPPGNTTDYDEDDPSIYYPPPYSFFFQMDNTTHVPPGPLVPGIVLPPPPDFFAPLEPIRKKPQTTKRPTPRPTTVRPTTTTEATKQIHPTTTPLPPTSVNNKPTRIKPVEIHSTQPPRIVTIFPVKYHTTNRTFSPITTTLRPYVPQRNRKKPPSVTVLKPVKPSTSTSRPVYFYENNEVNGRPYKIYGPPTRQRTVISSTQIPLKAYYSTSNEIDTNSVTQAPEPNYYPRGGISTPQAPKTTKSPTQFYFYEEEAVTNNIPTQRPPKDKPNDPYFNIPKEYYIPAKQTNRGRQPKPIQPQFYYVTNRPSRPSSRYRFVEATKKPDTFSVHVARLKQQLHQYYTTPDPYYDRPQSSSKPVYQFSFQAANYQPQQNSFRASPLDDGNNNDDKFRPINKYSVQIQPAIEVLPTGSPQYQNTPAPPPIYYQQQKQIVSTARPVVPSKYYSTPRPDYEYEDVDEKSRYVATPRPISQYSFQATPNPIYQPYYTKQEEPYFDDITKKYFTIFGKKIPAVTTPISDIEATTPRHRPVYSNSKQNVHIQYAQSIGKEVSLDGDGLNYERTRNDQAEYANRNRQKYPQVAKYNHYEPASLHSDINVNYKHPRPQVNAQAEIVEAIPVKISGNNENKRGSFISYELPGDDGAHFYFLTPQLAQRRDQGAGFYYENPDAPRIRRSEKDS